MTRSDNRPLVRVMGQWDLIALTLNSLIASAIYFLPGTIAGLVGPWSPVAHIVCVVVTLTFVLSFAEAASRFTTAGGPYLYAYEAFGQFIGFGVGWLTYLTRLAAVAANYNLFIIYLGFFFPSASDGAIRAIVMGAMITTFALINIRGVRYGAWTVDIVMIAKLIPILAVIIAGVFVISPSNLSLTSPPSYEGFMRTIFLLSFAYGGFEIATIPSGETVDPARHLPRALISGLLLAMVIYIGMQTVAVGVLPAIASEERPISAVAGIVLGSAGAAIVAFGALVSTTGYFSGSILSVPRLTFALAENRQLPAFFARVHDRFKTPYMSIVFYSVLVYLLAVFSNFITLAAISVVSRLIYYVTTCASVLVFRRKSRAPFTIIGGPVVPLLGIAAAVYLLLNTRIGEMLFTLGGIAIGTILYFLVQRLNKYGETT